MILARPLGQQRPRTGRARSAREVDHAGRMIGDGHVLLQFEEWHPRDGGKESTRSAPSSMYRPPHATNCSRHAAGGGRAEHSGRS